MIGTNPAAVNNAPLNTKDPESQNGVSPDQNPQGKRRRNLRKGAIVLICAATAGATLRALATPLSNTPPNNHAARILTPDTANSTCPEGTYRFNRASQLKRAKIGAGIGIGLIPGLGLASIAASAHFMKTDQECAANTALFLAGTSLVTSFASIPIAAGILAAAKSTKDGTCIKKNNNSDPGGSRG